MAILVLAMASPALSAQEDEGTLKTLFVMDLAAQNIKPEIAALVTSSISVSFEKLEIFQVRTATDVRQAMDIETQKEAMGCDTESCLAEIAGALGADYVAYGTVGSLGNSTLVTVNLYHHKESKSLGRERVQVEDQATLPSLMDQMVKDLLAGTDLAIVKAEPEEPEPSAFSSPLFWTGAGVFGLGAAAAAGLGIGAGVVHGTVSDGKADFADRDSAKGTGEMLVIGAAISGVVAAVGAGVAAVPLVME
jgi:hypothetical protein